MLLMSRATYSAIHKATGSLVTGRSLQNGKMSMGNCHTERSPEAVLYGSMQSGGFVNSGYSLDLESAIDSNLQIETQCGRNSVSKCSRSNHRLFGPTTAETM